MYNARHGRDGGSNYHIKAFNQGRGTPSFNSNTVGIGGDKAADSGEEQSDEGSRETHIGGERGLVDAFVKVVYCI